MTGVQESTSSLYLLVRVALSLGLVLGMVGIAIWVLRRRGPLGRRGAATDRLEVVDRRALSKGAHVALVRVGREDFLIGVTDQRVELLGRTEPAAPEVPEPLGAGEDVVVQLPAAEDAERPARPFGVAALPRAVDPRTEPASPPADTADTNTTDGGHRTLATRWTGHARPARCAAQETRMGFVEALRELTVRRS